MRARATEVSGRHIEHSLKRIALSKPELEQLHSMPLLSILSRWQVSMEPAQKDPTRYCTDDMSRLYVTRSAAIDSA